MLIANVLKIVQWIDVSAYYATIAMQIMFVKLTCLPVLGIFKCETSFLNGNKRV